MNTKPRHIPLWAVASATLTFGTLLSAILATVMLDAFLEGPGPASVTTRVPGFVYASATVMKVCIAAGLMLPVLALMSRLWADRAANAQGTPAHRGFAVWGLTSIILAPLTPIVGAVVVLTVQTLAGSPEILSMIDMSQFSRTAVIVKLLLLSAGAIAAVTSVVRRERPLLFAAIGLVTNVLLIGLFWHFEFYAVGFDQDTWAPRS